MLHVHLAARRGMILLEAGCTDAEVASLTGHTLAGGSIRAYAARTRALAESAYTKLMEREEVAALPVAQQAGEAASAALNR